MVSPFLFLKEAVDSGDFQQFGEVMNVAVIRQLPIRKIELPRLLRDARLQRTFDRVTAR
jgi:hypothetical protein